MKCVVVGLANGGCVCQELYRKIFEGCQLGSEANNNHNSRIEQWRAGYRMEN